MPLTRNRIRELRALAQKKRRDASGLFLIEGLRLVRDAAASSFEIPEAFATAAFEASPEGASLVGELRARGTHCQQVSAREIADISDTVHAQGVAALLRKKEWSAGELIRGAGALLVGLDGIADPGNLGTILRTADWFGAAGILLGASSVDPYNPKVVRATMGGIFRLPLASGIDLPGAASSAREHGYALIVAEPDAALAEDEIRFPARAFLVLGNEARGVSDRVRALADTRVAVRRYGAAESLNVGVSCGILLAAYRRQHRRD